MHRLAPLALIALLAFAAPAQGIYVVTDLEVFADRSSADVGDEVHFTVGPANESVVAKYAGRTLRVVFSADGAEEGQTASGEAGNVTLDGEARGAFSWTVPPEVDDRNAFLSVMDGEEAVGTAHVAVGDAPPMLMAAGGQPVDDPAPVGEAVDDGDDAPADARDKPAPGFTAVAILAAAAFVVLVLLPRRGRG